MTTHSLDHPIDESRPLSTARAAADRVFGVLSVITAALIALQLALAALGAFGGSFALHETVGTVIGAMTLLMLIAALIARPDRRTVTVAVVLFVLAGPVQPILAMFGWNVTWLGVLHGLNAAIIFGLTDLLILEARGRRASRPSAAT